MGAAHSAFLLMGRPASAPALHGHALVVLTVHLVTHARGDTRPTGHSAFLLMAWTGACPLAPLFHFSNALRLSRVRSAASYSAFLLIRRQGRRGVLIARSAACT